MARVVSNGNSIIGRHEPRIDDPVAAVLNWVNEDQGAATIEFGEYRCECGVTNQFSAVTRDEADTIKLEYVESQIDLTEAAVQVRKRHCRKHANRSG